MSRQFVARLDEARSPISSGIVPDIKKTPSKTTESKEIRPSEKRTGTKLHSETDSSSRLDEQAQSKIEYNDKSDILDKLSEYLFDLFDANLMEDYMLMETFEIKAIESFRNYEESEFTHEQHALHREFVSLFEQLVEGFLKKEGYTIDVFYDELVHFMKHNRNKGKNSSSSSNGGSGTVANYTFRGSNESAADEVMEVISSYMEFDVWAGLMRKQAQMQSEFRSTREKLQDAATAMSNNGTYNADSKAAAHRLDEFAK